jgi:1-acyl-sn-glycerol-3-phosphate acyltransferase
MSHVLRSLPPPVKGVVAFQMCATNTLACAGPLFALAIPKFLVPDRRLQAACDRALSRIAETWIDGNGLWMGWTQATRWDVEGVDDLAYRGWYLVASNHQSWVDIFVLQHVLNHRIPMLKFFLKRELIRVPVLGLAWWALDFPFLRRHDAETLARHPELRTQDIQTTRKACERFSRIPTSVMNFLEGTRFSEAKRETQGSPYRHLLKPKAGGIAHAIEALGDRFQSLLDVTIVYPGGRPSFWDFLAGRVTDVRVRVRSLPIPADLLQGDYDADPEFRARFQQWVQGLWEQKDRQIEELLRTTRDPLPSGGRAGTAAGSTTGARRRSSTGSA